MIAPVFSGCQMRLKSFLTYELSLILQNQEKMPGARRQKRMAIAIRRVFSKNISPVG
jgi:hypothetical protein